MDHGDRETEQLIERARATADVPWTPKLAFQQRVSGIMAGLRDDDPTTREEIENFVRREYGYPDEF